MTRTDPGGTDPVLALEELGQADWPQAGGKAANLGALLAAGFPVPPGFCLTVAAFAAALEPWQPRLASILDHHHLNPAAGTEAAASLTAHLEDWRLPAGIVSVLDRALARRGWQHTPLAVRSSAPGEDRGPTSFAGQYETVLGVVGLEALRAAVLRVWRSFFSAHALAARARAAGPPDLALAVLVQPVIPAECAGMAYSMDPVRRRTDQMLISAAWGLGAGVADGSVAADTARLYRGNLEVAEHLVAVKTMALSLAAGGQLVTGPVPDDRRFIPCLPDPWLERLGQLTLAVEQQLAQAQNIEWAIAGDQVWLLQSRPIPAGFGFSTSSPPFPVAWHDDTEPDQHWRRTPLGPNEIVWPLEEDYLATMNDGEVEKRLRTGQATMSRARVWNGRVYFASLPSPLPEHDRQFRRQALRDLEQRLRREERTLWDHYGPEVIQATRRLAAFEPANAGGLELAAHLEEAFAAVRQHAIIHGLVWAENEDYFQAYESLTGRRGPLARAAASQFIQSEESIFTEIVDGLYALAQAAVAEPAVAALISQAPDDAREQLAALPPTQFQRQLAAFLERFGDRSGTGFGSEKTIASLTWRDDQPGLFRLVAAYMSLDLTPPAESRARARRALNEQIEALCAGGRDPAAAARFRRELIYARRCALVLEEHNHYIDQLSLGQLRRAILSAGQWLAARRALERPALIFWLHRPEILAGLRAPDPARHASEEGWAAFITDRIAERETWAALEAPLYLGRPPSRLPPADRIGRSVPGPADPIDGDEGPELRGLGASPGRYRGRARVAPPGAALPEVRPGEILIAAIAGPAWTPLFPILGGLVLEQGGPGQHAAATAREYGLPAVVRLRGATRRIRDGSWIEIDGAAGLVYLDAEPETVRQDGS